MPRMRRGLALIEWMLLAVAALMLLALLIPVYARSGRHAQLAACQGRLKDLHRAQAAAPPAPDARGFAYWTRLTKAQPPLVAAGTLRCPFVPEAIQRDCDYFGPKSDAAGLDPSAPLACDIPENHEPRGRMGGNVLYKSGEVRALHPREGGDVEDPWREAAFHKCGP